MLVMPLETTTVFRAIVNDGAKLAPERLYTWVGELRAFNVPPAVTELH
jgi:hypothetical protein